MQDDHGNGISEKLLKAASIMTTKYVLEWELTNRMLPNENKLKGGACNVSAVI